MCPCWTVEAAPSFDGAAVKELQDDCLSETVGRGPELSTDVEDPVFRGPVGLLDLASELKSDTGLGLLGSPLVDPSVLLLSARNESWCGIFSVTGCRKV